MKKAIDNIFESKLFWMLSSLLIAFGIWLFIINSVNPSQTMTLTFQIQFENEGVMGNYNLQLASNTAEKVNLRVQASAKDIIKLEENPVIVADLSGVTQAGSHDVPFTFAASNLTGGVSVRPMGTGISNSDNTIIVETVLMLGKTFPIGTGGVDYRTASPQEALTYIGGKPSVEPESVQIDGPEELLGRIASVEAVYQFSEPLMETTTQTAPLRLLDADGEEIPESQWKELVFSAESTAVTVAVETVKEVPLEVTFQYGAGANPGNVQYSLSQETVKITGERAQVMEVNSILLGPVRLDRMELSSSSQIEIITPALTKIFQGKNTVTLNVEIAGLVTREVTVSKDQIAFVGVSEGLNASVYSDSVTLTIRGPAEKLEDLDSDSIAVLVDLTEYTSPSGHVSVDSFAVQVGDYPPEEVGAMNIKNQTIIVYLKKSG